MSDTWGPWSVLALLRDPGLAGAGSRRVNEREGWRFLGRADIMGVARMSGSWGLSGAREESQVVASKLEAALKPVVKLVLSNVMRRLRRAGVSLTEAPRLLVAVAIRLGRLRGRSRLRPGILSRQHKTNGPTSDWPDALSRRRQALSRSAISAQGRR